MTSLANQILNQMRNGLVVSCQPVDDSPLNTPDAIVQHAQEAIAGGACALRIEGVKNVAAVRKTVTAPLIGIVKFDMYNSTDPQYQDMLDSPVRISPLLQHIHDLAEAGADIIAFDGTDRKRPYSREAIVKAIKEHGKLAMADCSSQADGDFCASLGVEIIGTTLSGYTDPNQPTPKTPDYELLNYFVQKGYNVMAEGRFNDANAIGKAFKAYGTSFVTVGTVITRYEMVVKSYLGVAPLIVGFESLQPQAYRPFLNQFVEATVNSGSSNFAIDPELYPELKQQPNFNHFSIYTTLPTQSLGGTASDSVVAELKAKVAKLLENNNQQVIIDTNKLDKAQLVNTVTELATSYPSLIFKVYNPVQAKILASHGIKNLMFNLYPLSIKADLAELATLEVNLYLSNLESPLQLAEIAGAKVKAILVDNNITNVKSITEYLIRHAEFK